MAAENLLRRRPIGNALGGAAAIPLGLLGGAGGVVAGAVVGAAVTRGGAEKLGGAVIGGTFGGVVGVGAGAKAGVAAGRMAGLPFDAAAGGVRLASRQVTSTARLGAISRTPDAGVERRSRSTGRRYSYRFGDFTRGVLRKGALARGAKSERAAGYRFGDLTRGIMSRTQPEDAAAKVLHQRRQRVNAARLRGVAKAKVQLGRRASEAVARVYAPPSDDGFAGGPAYQAAATEFSSAQAVRADQQAAVARGCQLFRQAIAF